MWTVAVALATVFALTTLPTPIYARYEKTFGFSQLVVTFIYAVYVIGTLGVLFLFGRLSDQFGRRRTMLLALAASVTSTLAYLGARGTPMLFVARAFTGFAIGLASGAAAAWIGELHARGDRAAAALVVTGAMLAGEAAGSLLSGTLSQYAPAPLHLSYLLYLGMLGVVVLMTRRVRETVAHPKPLSEVSFKPQLGVPDGRMREFMGPAITNFVVFSLVGFYSAITPSLLRNGLHLTNAATSGVVVAELFVASVAAIALLRHLNSRTAMLAGLSLMLPSLALLVIAQATRSILPLLAGTALGGAGAGLGFRGSLQSVNAIKRESGGGGAGVVSTYFIFGSGGNALPVLGIGVMTHIWSAAVADRTFAIVVALLGVGALLASLRSKPVG